MSWNLLRLLDFIDIFIVDDVLIVLENIKLLLVKIIIIDSFIEKVVLVKRWKVRLRVANENESVMLFECN